MPSNLTVHFLPFSQSVSASHTTMSLSEPFSISYAILPKADQSSSAISALTFEFEENIIKGCQSKVWLKHFYDNEKLTFFGDSNTAITKGLLSLLIHIFNNRTPKEILDSKLFFINDTGLCRFIGTQRSNGLEAMENKFKLIALNSIENG